MRLLRPRAIFVIGITALLCGAVILIPLLAQPLPFSSISVTEEFRLGVQGFHNGRHSEAIRSFSRVVAEEPNNQLARIWLGEAYFAAGFEEAALQEWRLANQIDIPVEPLAYTIEAVEARRSGRDLLLLRQPPNYVQAAEIGGRTPQEAPLFSRPAGLYPQPDGTLLLTSFANSEVLLLNVNGNPLRRYRSRRLPFDRPYDVVRGSDGSIFVSEFGSDRIVRFSSQGEQIARFNRAGPFGLLAGPQYIVTDHEDHIYVSDWGNRRIVKFNANGTFLLTMGRDVGLQDPTGVAMVDEMLYVADSGRNMLVRFDSDGNFHEEIPLPNVSKIEGLNSYDESHLLLVAEEAIYLYNLQFQSLKKIIEPPRGRIINAVRDANANIVATDFDRNQLFYFTPLDDLFSGLLLRIERIDSRSFPRVLLSLVVSDRFERAVVGLEDSNFTIIEEGQSSVVPSVTAADHIGDAVDILLLLPTTADLRRRESAIVDIAEELQSAQGNGAIGVVVAAEQSLLRAPLGSSDVQVRQALQQSTLSVVEWDFDGALQLAANELVRSYAKRALIIFSDGTLPAQAFSALSFARLSRRLKNNRIHLYVISTTAPLSDDPLLQLVEQSDGAYLSFAQPESFASIISSMQRKQDGRYTLQYTSNANNNFGRSYIGVEVIARLLQRSGGVESGYFTIR